MAAAQPHCLIILGQQATEQALSGAGPAASTNFNLPHCFLICSTATQAAWLAQVDNHIPDMTVRETFDFAARVQGSGSKAGAASGAHGCPDSMDQHGCPLAAAEG